MVGALRQSQQAGPLPAIRVIPAFAAIFRDFPVLPY